MKRGYTIPFLLMAHFLIPFAVSFVIAMVAFSEYTFLTLPTAFLFYGVGDYQFVKSVLNTWELPESFQKRYLPLVAPLLILLGSWAYGMVGSGGAYGGDSFILFNWLHIPSVVATFAFTWRGPLSLLFYVPLIHNLSLLGSYAFLERRHPNKTPIPPKQATAFGALCLAFALIGGTISFQRSQTLLPKSYGFDYGNGYSSVDLYQYDPENRSNILPTLEEPSFFHIGLGDGIPVLDGAEAAYPVYSAFAKACYVGIDGGGKDGHEVAKNVTFTNTIYAYERLLRGEVDIFFGAQPSEAQRKMAEEQGKTLTLTPIGKEAFVFFVSTQNPAENLTRQQIRDIYSGAINNWEPITGEKVKILPFQRPENSGSQTILQMIMGDTPIRQPLREEYVSGMGGVSQGVADYRNSKEALGYSFRFFTTAMGSGGENIRLLSIEGIAPTPENIQNDSYPFTVQLYAITLTENKNPNIPNFLQWMQGEQGQYLVKQVGYVPLAE